MQPCLDPIVTRQPSHQPIPAVLHHDRPLWMCTSMSCLHHVVDSPLSPCMSHPQGKNCNIRTANTDHSWICHSQWMTRWDHLCLWNVGPMAKLQKPMFAVPFLQISRIGYPARGQIKGFFGWHSSSFSSKPVLLVKLKLFSKAFGKTVYYYFFLNGLKMSNDLYAPSYMTFLFRWIVSLHSIYNFSSCKINE